MTCKGCVCNLKIVLSRVAGVVKVQADLLSSMAVIEMGNHIPVETFEKAL
jgi:Cu2+-exporting ATPase